MKTKRLSAGHKIGIAALAIVLIAGLGAAVRTVLCAALPSVPPDAVPQGRSLTVVVDRTGSMGDFAARACAVVVDRVLPAIGPGDLLDCLQVGTRRGLFDEEHDRLFITGVRQPGAQARPRPVDADQLCSRIWCDPNRAWRAALARQAGALAAQSADWARKLAARPPARGRNSSYLETFRFIERNLSGQKGERLLIVFGDLIHEGSPLPPAEAGDAGDDGPWAGVRVMLVRGEGTHQQQLGARASEYWHRYFESRGARVEDYSLEHFPGIPSSPVTLALAAQADRP